MIVSLENVSKIFSNKVVLNDINMTLQKGEITCLQGSSGSGKTTIIKILTSMIKPTNGKVTYKKCINPKEVIGYVSQDFTLYGDLTVKENLIFFSKIYNVDIACVNRQIKIFKLDTFEKTKANDLSGGWKQKLSIACATIFDPKILILDEPTAGVDPISRDELWDYIHTLKQNGMTILYTTHYLEEVFHADKLIFINSGSIVLKQMSPQMLLSEYKQNTMNELYYKVVSGEFNDE